MNTIEFSNEFDTLVNSYRRFKDFDNKEALDSIDFNEYEKSVYLTKAQGEIIVELYTGRNLKYASFEATEELRANLRNLIKCSILEEQPNMRSSCKAQSFKLPSDLLFIVYEEATISDENAGCSNGNIISIVPTSWDTFHKILNNPFRGPNKRRALRLDAGSDIIEVVSLYGIKDYTIRYLSRPTPIVLANFSEVSIDGVNEITECKLDPITHRDILERAVALALQSKGIQGKDNV